MRKEPHRQKVDEIPLAEISETNIEKKKRK